MLSQHWCISSNNLLFSSPTESTRGGRMKKTTPKKTVHAWCHYCVQSKRDDDVQNCTGHIVFVTGKPCPFYQYRLGHRRPRVKVLRQYCLECMGGRKDFVRECKSDDCMIHRYRLGKNPARVGIGNSKVAELRFQLTESIFLQSVGRNHMEKEA